MMKYDQRDVDARQKFVANLRERALVYRQLGPAYDSNGMDPWLNAKFLGEAADWIEQDGMEQPTDRSRAMVEEG